MIMGYHGNCVMLGIQQQYSHCILAQLRLWQFCTVIASTTTDIGYGRFNESHSLINTVEGAQISGGVAVRCPSEARRPSASEYRLPVRHDLIIERKVGVPKTSSFSPFQIGLQPVFRAQFRAFPRRSGRFFDNCCAIDRPRPRKLFASDCSCFARLWVFIIISCYGTQQ